MLLFLFLEIQVQLSTIVYYKPDREAKLKSEDKFIVVNLIHNITIKITRTRIYNLNGR